jgi:KDO2-lipid IV(A) lauroyltransferase
MLQILGAIIGFIASIFPHSMRRIIAINIALCFPELNAKAQRRLVRKTLIETGKTALEMPWLWLKPKAKLMSKIVEVRGEAEFKAAAAQHKGAILLSPHIGAWELLNPYLAKHFPMVIMYKPAKRAYLDQIILNARVRSGSTLVPTNTSGVKALYRALTEGKVVGLLPDQDPGKNGGEFAPFFNIPTLTMTLVARMAQKSQVPVYLVYAERLNIGRGFRIHFSPVNAQIAGTDTPLALAAMNHAVEQCIRQSPAQYQWSYKRFKHRPEGEAKIY